jgi:general nucleoside transport system permease protein
MILFIAFLTSVLRGATPLVFASMGGLLSERSGIIQIALEGIMLMGALFAAIGALYFDSAWMGFFLGGLAGASTALIFGFFALFLRTDQIIVGTGINLLAVGVAPFMTKILYNSTGSTPNLPIEVRFSFEPVVVAGIVAVLIWYLFSKTKAGLLMRFAGEEPLALAAAGYSVDKVRWLFLLAAGFVTGLGGGSLSLFLASSYSPNMTAGRGFMALAALIFGKWKPLPALGACLFFALIEAIQIRLQGVDTGVPVQWVQALPYLVTIIALAGFFGHSRAPKALGQHLSQK